MGEVEGEIKINEQTNKAPTKPRICANSVQFHDLHENPKEGGKECRPSLGCTSCYHQAITGPFPCHAAIPSSIKRQLLLTRNPEETGFRHLFPPCKSPFCFLSCLQTITRVQMFCIKLKSEIPRIIGSSGTKCNGNSAGLPEPNEGLPRCEHDAG